jgi:hypothetical protein
MSGHARARASTLEGAKSPDSSENLAARAREWTRVLICLSLVMKGSAVRIRASASCGLQGFYRSGVGGELFRIVRLPSTTPAAQPGASPKPISFPSASR